MPEESANSLNSNHERRLSVTCRYIDKLLADMESILSISSSKLAFPQYTSDISSAQRRVIEDYITRMPGAADSGAGWATHRTTAGRYSGGTVTPFDAHLRGHHG